MARLTGFAIVLAIVAVAAGAPLLARVDPLAQDLRREAQSGIIWATDRHESILTHGHESVSGIGATPLRDLFADHHLAGLRDRCESRRYVDRPPVHVAVLEDHRAGMDADVGRRESHRRSLLDHVQTGVHRAGRVPEVEHPSVAQPPDRAPAPAAGDVLHEGGELSGDIGRESINGAAA